MKVESEIPPEPPSVCAVILSAGQGLRLKNFSSKPLYTICGTPLLYHVLDVINNSLVCDVLLVVSPKLESELSDTVTEYSEKISKLNRVVQTVPNGTAKAVELALEKSKNYSYLLVGNADTILILPETINRLLNKIATHFPDIVFVTAKSSSQKDLGRVLRSQSGKLQKIVEYSEMLKNVQSEKQCEVNVGWYLFRTKWLLDNLHKITPAANGEYYLTKLPEVAPKDTKIETVEVTKLEELIGINTMDDALLVEQLMQKRIIQKHINNGVIITNPANVVIGTEVVIDSNTKIGNWTDIQGKTKIGKNSLIDSFSVLNNVQIGENVKIYASRLSNCCIEKDVEIGPFSHIRNGSRIEEGGSIGNFAEVKASVIGKFSKVRHFSYLGDSEVGRNVNIGAGSVTCNFDGKKKHRTVIGDNSFIGSDSMLIAPITIGKNSVIGAGSVVTKDVPANSKVIGSPGRIVGKIEEQN